MTQAPSKYYRRDIAEQYDDDRFSGSFGRDLHQMEVALFLKLSQECSGKFLDIGTGTGKLTIPLLRQGREVASLDQSQAMLDIAIRKIKAQGLEGRFFLSDAQDLRFKEREFDCVMASRVLMHIKDWRRALSEWCRVSQRVVIVDLPAKASFAGVDAFFTKSYEVFTVNQIRKCFEKYGYRVVKVHKGWFLPLALHRILNRPVLSRALENFFSGVGLTRLLGSPVTVKAVRIQGAV